MKCPLYTFAVAVFLLTPALFAESVNLNPETEGGRLEQAEAIVGDVDVVVNDAANGAVGTVALSRNNAYTGETIVPAGVLEVPSVGLTGGTTSLGSGGRVVMDQAVLRFTGATPATTDFTFTNNAPSFADQTDYGKEHLSVFDLRQDVTFMGDIVSDWGCFAKIGPGTMSVGGNFKICQKFTNGNSARPSSCASRFVPGGTVGYSGFNVFEGAFKVNGGAFGIPTSDPYFVIGGWTAADGEQETDAEFEVNGGSVSCNTTATVGYYHGFKNGNTPNGPATSTLRMNGGTFAMSGGKYLYVGPSSMPSEKTYNSRVRVEVHGGTLSASSASWGTRISAYQGVDAEIWIDGGTMNATRTGAGLVTSYASNKTSEGRQQITVCSNGVFNTTLALTGYSSSNYIPLNMDVFDGGSFRFNAILNNYPQSASYPNRTVTTITVDDGVLSSYGDFAYLNETNWINAAGIDVRIGSKGAVLNVRHAGVHRIGGAFQTAAGLAQDGGVVVSNAANRVVEYAAPMAYAGPTTVKGGFLSLHGEGALPAAANAVTLLDGGLMLRDAPHTVGTLVIGAEGETCDAKLKVAEGCPLVVTDDFQVKGDALLQVSLVDESGADHVEAKENVKVLTVPASCKAALQALRVTFEAAASSGTISSAVVDDAEGTCSLVVTTALKASYDAEWINPAGGSWNDSANWKAGVVPASAPGVIVRFKTTAQQQNAIVTLPSDGTVTLGQFLVSASTTGYRFMGGSFTMDNLGRGAILSAASGSSRNRIDADLILNEDTRITYASSTRRWTLAGRLLGTGHLTFGSSGGDSLRVAMDGTLFANDPSRITFEPGTSYLYTPNAGEDKVEGYPTDRIIGGYQLEGSNKTHTVYVYDGTLTVTAAIQRASSTADWPNYVKQGAGTLSLGFANEPRGDFPIVDVSKFYVAAGRAEFNSGVLKYDSLSLSGSLTTDSIVFNGTVLKQRVNTTGLDVMASFHNAYIGARGLVLDTSDYAVPEEGRYSAKINQILQHDPSLPEGVKDGGITICGPNRVGLNATSNSSTFDGPVTVKPGAGLLNVLTSDTAMVPGALILGANGASESVEVGFVQKATMDGIIVCGPLSVLSPVVVRPYASSTSLTPTFADGDVYKILTYDPAQTPVDPDLNLFSKQTDVISRRLRFEIVSLTDGKHAGWKQIRATVVGGADAADAVWTATSAGGAWNEAANWNGGTPPNGVDNTAFFRAATAQNVGVVVPEGTTVGALTIDTPENATYGYSFTGAPLNFATTHAGTSGLALQGGSAQFAALSLADDLALRVDTNSTFTVQRLTGDRHVTINADKVLGGGKTVLDTSDFTGGLTTGSGTVEVNDLGFVDSAEDLELSTGTLDYTGDSVEIAGLTTAGNPNYSYTSSMLKLKQGVTLTLLSAEAKARSMLALCGKGTLRLKGNGTFNLGMVNVNSGTGTYTRDSRSPNGDGPRSAIRSFSIANGKLVIGTVDDPNDAPTVNFGSDFAMALASTKSDEAVPEFEMNNGIVNVANFYPAYKHAVSSTTRITKVDINGGTVNCRGSVYIQEMNAPVVMTVNGGSFNATQMYSARAKGSNGRFSFIQNGGTCVFTNVASQYSSSYTGLESFDVLLKGGTFVCLEEYNFSKNENARKSKLTIAGGDFSYGSLALAATTFKEGRPEMRFNGGIVRPLAAGKVEDVATLYISTNATTFTTAGYATGDYEFAQPLLTDPELEGAVDGGLVKMGANNLVLSAANTFTGPLVVQEGSVVLGAGGSLACPVALNGTTLVAPQGVDLVGLYGAGLVDGSLATAALAPGRKDEPAFTISGNLTLANEFTLDFGRIESTVMPGDRIPLCRVGGTVSLPTDVTLVNAKSDLRDAKLSAALVVEDGVVYATIKTSGLMILFR